MANSKITLTYFDLTGRAEIIRLILHFAGKEFEDRRIPREEWPEIKPTSPFGQVPFVEIDGKAYGQSIAIANYFAREFNLYGKTNIDGLKVDQFFQLVEDYFQEVIKAFRETDEVKKAEITKQIKEEVAPKFLGFFARLLEENGGEYLVGDSFSQADIGLYDIVTGFVAPYTAEAAEKFPSIKALVERVGNNEGIRAYKASRP